MVIVKAFYILSKMYPNLREDNETTSLRVCLWKCLCGNVCTFWLIICYSLYFLFFSLPGMTNTSIGPPGKAWRELSFTVTLSLATESLLTSILYMGLVSCPRALLGELYVVLLPLFFIYVYYSLLIGLNVFFKFSWKLFKMYPSMFICNW